ncbi:bacteriocin-associated integral membrane family protein [Streptomyces sp. NBC_01800]|uniref:bacteriocin-associated integral membrane family protein n=1 Tax=Streptomyces sp. NBC_01800 TaxID=2975945 RepID=UPI002DDA32FF|nr:hypothetical protein [Streptomyces sp. NBC_01800]WSA69693.1 hypothetical protein OIE65_23540 [Streptomyces sp. NBC_01800]
MLHRGIKFVHAAVLVFSAMMSFLFVRGLDEELVLGSSAQIWVSDSDDSVSGAQVVRAIAAFSNEYGVAVARELPDVKNPDGRRHLYLASGDSKSEAASWLKEGYPAFSGHVTTHVHPIVEIGQRDPRGFYYVFGSPEAADALVAEFADLGLGASAQHPLAYSELALLFSGDDLLWSFWVVALAAVTMTGASVLLSAKNYGVLRLQGKSFMDLLARDLRQLATFWTLTAGAVGAGVLGILGLYNGLAWLGLFTLVAACLAGLLILFVLVAHAAALALTFRVGVLRALKGELPARTAFVATYLVRIPAVLLALGFAMDVTLASQHVMARQDNQDIYVKAGDAVTIRLNGSWGGDSKPVVAQVGRWLRRADAAGEIIVAGREDLQNISSKARLPKGEMLIVNENFLDEQPVFGLKGQRYLPVPRGKRDAQAGSVRLIIPETLGRHTSDIRATIPDVFGRLDPEVRRRLKVETLQAKSGQRVFGYNSGDRSPNAAYTPDDDRSLLRDPVLVVVPNGSNILTNDAYTTFATQDGIVFPHPGDVLKPLEANKNGLQAYVAAVNPVGQNAALRLREAVNESRLLFFNLIASVAVLLITGFGVCIIHSRKNAQAVFAQHISGWRFTATHRFVLAVEGLVAAFLAWWVPIQVWQQHQDVKEFTSRGIPSPFPPVQITVLDLSAIGGLVVIEFCAVLLALGVFHRRIVKEGGTAT